MFVNRLKLAQYFQIQMKQQFANQVVYLKIVFKSEEKVQSSYNELATSILVYNRLLFIYIHSFINVTCNNEHIITVFHTINISIYFCCKITTLIVMVNSM